MTAKPTSYLEISKSALVNNIKQFKKLLPEGNVLVAVVKANAYGHGLQEVVKVTQNHVDMFQVDDIDELKQLRKFTSKKTLVFGYVAERDLEQIVIHGAVLGVSDLQIIRSLDRIAKSKNKVVSIHLKIDAYLGRQGIFTQDIKKVLGFLKQSKNIVLEAVYSHFSNIEDVANLSHAHKQYDYLIRAKEIIVKHGFTNITHHISATAGLMTSKDNWGGSLVRLGIGMYGLWPSERLKEKHEKKIKLKPVLSWYSEVAQVKVVPKRFPIGYGMTYITKQKTKIAVIPQGYSDGYDRRLSNRGFVLINKSICPVLGRIAMNMFVVDVTRAKGVHIGDRVVLVGRSGDFEVTVSDMSDKGGILNYEVVARMPGSIKRLLK